MDVLIGMLIAVQHIWKWVTGMVSMMMIFTRLSLIMVVNLNSLDSSMDQRELQSAIKPTLDLLL